MAHTRTVTLTADEEETVTFPYNGRRVEVFNIDGAAEVWFTTDNTPATVGGDGCIPLAAVISSVEVDDEVSGNAVVRLISPGTPRVHVRVW
ncbi:hypothetical protein [Verrucosispora sp. WMMC514]|uniref:hypothetical protein n=1 Tax=Verrucosispora sp. WMMC514 TaxID=3015156 RepID=UPI00248CF21F|nr:hypothetical protein [Verrucosispora sp. WMMC514]WBB94192.1 hypothetical protein O7597_15185 [Verrucosispora sp. WMMC514]